MFSVIISMRIISIKHHGELAGKTPDVSFHILLFYSNFIYLVVTSNLNMRFLSIS
jgi:hypothetical protein